MKVQVERIKILNDKEIRPGPIVYWMSRDQRLRDNWALLYAQELALTRKVPLVLFFGLVPSFLGSAERQYDFMLRGLAELNESLAKFNVPFAIRSGSPDEELKEFCQEIGAGCVVCDFSPLRLPRTWKSKAAKELQIALVEVDAHNIVPCWMASPKQEFAAYTLRPKIHRLLGQFLNEFPELKVQAQALRLDLDELDFDALRFTLRADRIGKKISWAVPGEKAAHEQLKALFKTRLARYAQSRNDPNVDAQSSLSPYLHFGQISAQRVALELSRLPSSEASEAFLEELVVRRELSENFCFYNPDYDNPRGFPDWAKRTLLEHVHDERQYIYTLGDFESARTHDELWNAAQREMVATGKMHGYMRMYWAKKILEWTPSVEVAMQIAIELNDRYELDGRDPNGYCGIAWSIGGVHDRAWFDRAIFGKIRFMSYNGCKSKFDVDAYIAKVNSLSCD